MKKLLVVLLSSLFLFVSGCSDDGSADGGAVELTVAHIYPNSHPGGVFLDKLAEQVKDETNGEVTLQINHNAVLGSEADELQQIQAGNLDMALFYGIANFQAVDKVFGVEELPFVFNDINHVRKAYDGAYGDKLTEMLREHNFEVLSYWENGFRHFTNNKKPIVKPEDMKGIKFRSAEIPLRLQMFELLDANAISMGFNELFTGLQQGTVDGQENPLATINSSKFYEVQDYLSLSGHIYNSSPLILSTSALEKLSEEQQNIVREIAGKLKVEQQVELDKQNKVLEQQLADQGMKVNEIDKETFQEAVKPLWKSFIDEHGDELVNLILDEAE